MLGDAVVLIATWMKTWSIHRGIKSTNIDARSDVSLPELLLRDGTIYFVALLCLNIAALVLSTTPQVMINPVGFFATSFSSILLCRLILNLRSFNVYNTSTTTTNARQITSVRFANAVLNNIGASVSLGEYGDRSTFERHDHSQVDATWDEVSTNPLAIGLEEEIRRMRRDEIEEEIPIESEEEHSENIEPDDPHGRFTAQLDV